MKKNFTTIFLSFLVMVWFEPIYAERLDSVDVLHYNLETTIRNFSSKQIQGTATLTTLAKFNNTKSVVFDLQKLIVSAAFCNNLPINYTQTDSTISFGLNQTYQTNDTLRFRIEYAGTPATDKRWGGFYFNGNYAYNMGVGMASNPPNFGRVWFPCIDNFTDKATYEFHITTDTGFMAVCNGLQEPAIPTTDGGITWHWRLSQEIPTYIANVAVSKYVLVKQEYQGIERKIPIILAANASDTANLKNSFGRLNQALQCFENKFGPYQFDRVGYVGVPFNSGAMEHAGNISYPIYAIDGLKTYETLFAHELSHHWFGNLVTCRTASDMWLNEGWASYCEALFLECVDGKDAYDKQINSELFEALRWAHVRDSGYYAVAGVPLPITYGTHVYTKGGLMAHSLRMLINNDTAFFNTIKSYLKEYQFKTASTADFQQHFENRFGGMITSFFDSYIYDKGHVDLQTEKIGGFDMMYSIWCHLQSRYRNVLPSDLPIRTFVSINHNDGKAKILPVTFVRLSDGRYLGEIPIFEVGGYGIMTIGEITGSMLGASTQKAWVKGTSVQTFPNVLLTITPQQNPDSSFIIIQHHFATPWQENKLYPKGIRISSERYWNIDGYWNPNFKSTAFFNYEGSKPANKKSGYLDNELITGTEDSLVLLYRPDASSPFIVETDLTYQPGANNTDKTGRFWVNNLKKGDYVFGYRDFTASVQTVKEENRTMKLYPNPTDGILNIELPKNHSEGKFTVINMNGAVIMEMKVYRKDNELSAQTGNWAKGNYILIFEDGKGKLSQNFIVK